MEKKRLRDYGLTVGQLPTGKWNSITDVADVGVGHFTLDTKSGDGTRVCTGVTAILPHRGNLFQEKVVAASHVINGFGKTTGLVQVDELGTIESPIMLTNTFGVPAVTEGALRYMLAGDEAIGDRAGSLNVVVGECNDSFLNDMRGLHVRPEHAIQALENVQYECPVTEGAVGAGTGMVCFGWKGGIGTSSRQIVIEETSYHIGVLVLTNFGRGEDLTILGHPIGRSIEPSAYKENSGPVDAGQRNQDGSIMIIVATDIPMDSRQLKRIAKRASFGLSRTGSIAHHGSGDVVIAFSNGNRISHDSEMEFYDSKLIREDGALISQCFRAVVEATEEAILNSLFMAHTTHGRDERVVRALPIKDVLSHIKKDFA